MASIRPPRPPNGLHNENPIIDDTNGRLLCELAGDPRLSHSELARRVGMSPPAVRERIARLEQAGVIRGYRLDVDPAHIGLPLIAWVRVKPGPGQLANVAALASRVAEISECYRISGEDCFLIKIHIANLEALESILDQFLVHGQTTSSFVVSTPVPPRLPAPSNARALG